MKHIAITGVFCSGKSTTLRIAKEMGYKSFSCDEYVSSLYKDNKFWDQVKSKITCLSSNNKKYLANIIFNNKKERQKLESIIHPLVRKEIEKFEYQNKNNDIIFSEVPLLFENNFDTFFSKSISVYCSEEERWIRANERGIKDKELYKKIIGSQLNQEQKNKLSDYQIDSTGDIKNQIDNIIKRVKHDK